MGPAWRVALLDGEDGLERSRLGKSNAGFTGRNFQCVSIYWRERLFQVDGNRPVGVDSSWFPLKRL